MKIKTKIHSSEARKGFSLIELLVVIGIIALLTTITLISMGGAGTAAREEATRATILKITTILNERKQAFGRQSFKTAASEFKLDDSKREDLILTKKIMFKRVFPQFGSEALVPKSVEKNEAESSENLYRMIIEGDTFGIANPGADNFSQREVGDTDGDGNLEFLDGWGRPLRFYRWPTRLIRPGGGSNSTNPNGVASVLISSLPTQLEEDPDDTFSRVTLVNITNPAFTFIREFKSGVAGEKYYHTLNTWHSMLIVSPGEDNELGLYEPWDTDNYGHLAEPTLDLTASPTSDEINELKATLGDNITNLQQGK